MFKYFTTTIFILWIISVLSVCSQEEDCVFKLREAEKLYQQGLIEEIPDLINECIQEGFSKEDRLQAFKLLILTYLFEDEIQKAEDAMYNFIKKYPEYEIVPTDPLDFVYLYESYKAVPIVSFGASVGYSLANTTISERYGTHDLTSTHGDFNQSGLGLQLGLKVNFFVYENTEVNLEFLYAQNKFEYVDEELYDFAYLSFDETQTRLDIPVSVTYDFDIKSRFTPFARLGCNFGILMNSNALSSVTYTDDSHEKKTGPDMDISNQRNPFNYWGILGTGIKYKIPKGYLMADVQYNLGLSGQTNENERYSDFDQAFYYYHLDDNFKLNTLNFRLGYIYTIYKPTKKK